MERNTGKHKLREFQKSSRIRVNTGWIVSSVKNYYNGGKRFGKLWSWRLLEVPNALQAHCGVHCYSVDHAGVHFQLHRIEHGSSGRGDLSD